MRSGRPIKLTSRDVKFMASLVARGKVKNAVQLQECFLNMLVGSVQRRLREAGVRGGSSVGVKTRR